MSQERTAAEFHRHQAKQLERRKEEQKEQFRQHVAELSTEITALRRDKEGGDVRLDELKHENHLLQEKFEEETRKVRALQESMINMKRKRGSESPIHDPSL